MIAIGLFLAAIVGPAGFYAHEFTHGKSLVSAVATDVKRHDLVRGLDRDFAQLLAAPTSMTIGLDTNERSDMLADAVAGMRRLLALDSSLDRLIGATGDLVPPRDHIALWDAAVAIGESLDHFAAWERIGATDEERSFHILRTYDNVQAARRVLGRIDDMLDERIKATLEASDRLLGAAVPILWTMGLAGALIGAAVALFVLASIRRLQHTRRELEASEAELSDQNRLFKDAIESMSQGLSMFDGDNRLIVCNERYVDLYGMQSLAPKPGMPFDEIARFRRESGVVFDREVTLEQIAGTDTSWLATLPNGRVVAVSGRVRASGGWVGTHTDITDLVRAEAQRVRAEAESVKAREDERAAEAACKAKSAFFAMMSHEIRTPLNGLLGLAVTLLETTLDTDQRKTLEAINQSGESLLAILNDILDLSKLEAGRVQFECIAFSPRELADDLVGVLGPQARAKGIAMYLSVAGTVPPLMLGDPSRIRQVLLNLAGNAVKFTPTGGEVEVVLGCTGRDAASATLEWTVHDSGIGIAPERIATLFSDYVQADSSINRRFGGTGLGLAICKRLVEQMGGEVAVQSVLDKGSTFTVRLPLAVTDVPRNRSLAGPVSHAAFTAALGRLARPLRVLLVEDNATNQMVVTRMLKSFDITIRIAEDGFQAVAAVAEFACDVILMDVRMPGMDGLEATRRIRARGGRWSSMPIIALTANAFPDDVQACREAGMTGFIAKPVRKTVLIESLAQAVQAVAYAGLGVDDNEPLRTGTPRTLRRVGAGHHAPAPAQEAGSQAVSGVPVLDPAATEMLRAEIGDDGLAATFACFLDDTRGRLAALRMLAAGADRKTLGIEAHTLKGAAGALGFRRLAELALALETEADVITAARAVDLTMRLDAAFAEAHSAAERLHDHQAA